MIRDFLKEWALFFGPLLSAVVIVVGWHVGHRLSARRDKENRAREKLNDFLITAYRSIEQACVRKRENGTKYEEPFEMALADIQLFGSSQQVALARKVVSEIEEGSYSDPRVLLDDLRKQLRADLGLETIGQEIRHFRFGDEHSNDPQVRNPQQKVSEGS